MLVPMTEGVQRLRDHGKQYETTAERRGRTMGKGALVAYTNTDFLRLLFQIRGSIFDNVLSKVRPRAGGVCEPLNLVLIAVYYHISPVYYCRRPALGRSDIAG